MNIRPELAQDGAAIHQVTQMAFANAPHASGTEGDIVAALRADHALALSLVAEVDGQILGHIAFSSVLIDGRDLGWLGLGPISVHPDHQGQGIGSALMRAGLDGIKAKGAKGCVVLGEPEFYRRFGFVQDGLLKFEGAPPEFFMSLAFREAREKGVVTYHPAFYAA